MEQLALIDERPTGRAKPFTLSPNDIDRAEVCPYSRVIVGPKPKMHPGMWYGIFVHRFLEFALTKGHAQALAYVKSKRNKNVINVCSRIDINQIPGHAMPEMTLAIDTENRTAEVVNDWEDAHADRHVAGKLDLLYKDDLWHVADYKTGESHGLVPENSTQLQTLALGVSLLQGEAPIRASIIDVLSTGQLVWHTATFSRKRLQKIGDRIRHVHLEVLESRAEYADGLELEQVPGTHCQGCRAQSVCTSYVETKLDKRMKKHASTRAPKTRNR